MRKEDPMQEGKESLREQDNITQQQEDPLLAIDAGNWDEDEEEGSVADGEDQEVEVVASQTPKKKSKSHGKKRLTDSVPVSRNLRSRTTKNE